MNTHRVIRLLLLSFLAALHLAAAPPTTGPATQPKPLTAQERQRVLEMSRQAVGLIKAEKLEQAEAILTQAIQLAPGLSGNLYNMACLQARQGKPQLAMDWLERAARGGFTNFALMERDPDLQPLRSLERFNQLLARKEEYLKRAAERVVGWLQRELGEGYLFEVDSENKLIFATNTDAPTLQALKNALLIQLNTQQEMLFSHRPDRYVSIVLPSAEDFKKIIPRAGAGGIYDHSQRVLVAGRMGQVMRHEFTHALHNCDLDATDQEHAVWISEGLAAMFEGATFQGNRLVPGDNYRLVYIQDAARGNRLIPLERLSKMNQDQFLANPWASYGQAGSVMLYLHERGLLRKFYETYKATWEKDKTGRLALEQTTGQKLPELERLWKTWMLARTPPAAHTGPRGAYLGVRFNQANDGLRIEYILPASAAAQAGLLRGDLIVGIDGLDVRDQQSFMPLLADHEPGERITLKIRRKDQYLDLPLTLGQKTQAPAPRPASKR